MGPTLVRRSAPPRWASDAKSANRHRTGTAASPRRRSGAQPFSAAFMNGPVTALGVHVGGSKYFRPSERLPEVLRDVLAVNQPMKHRSDSRNRSKGVTPQSGNNFVFTVPADVPGALPMPSRRIPVQTSHGDGDDFKPVAFLRLVSKMLVHVCAGILVDTTTTPAYMLF